MAGFVQGVDRGQSSLCPASVDDYVAEDNPVRAVELFVEGLDLGNSGSGKSSRWRQAGRATIPRPCSRSTSNGYLNRVPPSRRLERECQRNLELIWLTGSLAPDFKTIADFRKDNGEAIREVCREFVALCRRLQLLTSASVAIDGSKFKAVNARDKNFTKAKMQRRLERLDGSIARYLSQLETAAIRETADPLRVNLNPAARSTKLDLLVEGSDNSDELGERLSEYEAMRALHLSCHFPNAWQVPGQPKAAPKPVLLLETEEGRPPSTSASDLIGALRGNGPRLVFLSACLTARRAVRSAAGLTAIRDGRTFPMWVPSARRRLLNASDEAGRSD
jgi:transposase